MFYRETHEQRTDTIATHAWEAWTKNGLGMDFDEMEQTNKSARDAAANTYADGMDDMTWLAATIARLTGRT